MPDRLVLLVTTHRVAPGLLSFEAWEQLRAADVVMARPHHPLTPAVRAAGIPVSESSGESEAHLAQHLLALTEPVVVWLAQPEGEDALTAALAPAVATMADQGRDIAIEVVPGSYDLPGARLLDVVAVMDRLRSPGGCPWDAKQTHVSLAPYLIEETFEALAAIDNDDQDALRDELGDVLLQVVFHARLGEESRPRPWSIDDVAGGLVAKLVRRHPHVFGEGSAETAEEVERNWEQLKQEERTSASLLDDVPLALPALALSDKLLTRTARSGVDLVVEEPELPDRLDEEVLGALLFGVVSAARRQGMDAEGALRRYAHGFAEKARLAEQASVDR